MSNLTTSSRGLNLIKKWEGFRPDVYLCPAGKRTVGWGHVLRPSEKLSMGNSVTIAQAEDLLAEDCKIAERYLNAVLAPFKIKGASLNQNEFDALVCFCFNLGVGALDKSTLLRYLQAGNRKAASAEFGKFCHIRVEGKLVYSKGLFKRRMDEMALFLTKSAGISA